MVLLKALDEIMHAKVLGTLPENSINVTYALCLNLKVHSSPCLCILSFFLLSINSFIFNSGKSFHNAQEGDKNSLVST